MLAQQVRAQPEARPVEVTARERRRVAGPRAAEQWPVRVAAQAGPP
ncbi:MAG TPA: hypothetical protein VLQ93_13350 [Myxococcaceae bacterium]|nr:hypothetical protein [Myxococcaceae bacterium]